MKRWGDARRRRAISSPAANCAFVPKIRMGKWGSIRASENGSESRADPVARVNIPSFDVGTGIRLIFRKKWERDVGSGANPPPEVRTNCSSSEPFWPPAILDRRAAG